MTNRRTYLDFNATAPLLPQARAAVMAALDACGNPSSVHAEGRAARRIVELAREQVAALVGGESRNVVFTSGGTEANMLALSPALGDRLLVSAIEHPSVLAGGRYAPESVERIPVNVDGIVDLTALRSALAKGGHPLVSLMLANNESGVVQPVCEAARLVHEAGGLLHVDAVQAAGRISCDINALGADFMTISGHKIGAPKGVGALIKRSESLHLDPLIKGGGQERGARAGTENVAAIAGMGAAASDCVTTASAQAPTASSSNPTASSSDPAASDYARQMALRAALESGLKSITPAVVIFGADSPRLPNTTLFSVPGLKAETALIAFDLEGVAVSSGAACSSGKVQPSHVLAAMGLPLDLARGAVRVSLGPTTTESEINHFLEAWNRVSGALLSNRQGLAA
jgi:cysteine desulfurase